MPLKKKVTKPAFRRRVFRCSIGFSLQYSGAQRPWLLLLKHILVRKQGLLSQQKQNQRPVEAPCRSFGGALLYFILRRLLTMIESCVMILYGIKQF